MRFLFLTMDGNHGAALREAASQIQQEYGFTFNLSIYNATDLHGEEALKGLQRDIDRADFIFGAMLFGEDLVRPLQAILETTDKPICIITSNPALIRCTRIGKFLLAKGDEDEKPGLIKRWLNKLRPKSGKGEGKRQLSMLKNMGKIMKFIPGKVRDVHTYMSVHEYWMHASPENLRRMMCMLIDRYTDYNGNITVDDPINYPNAAIYHPDAPQPFPDLDSYLEWRSQQNLPTGRNAAGTVGLLSLRTVILSGNTQHMDALIRSLEAQNIEVRTAYSAGLDFRPAITQFFTHENGQSSVDLLLNGAGFSLVGGMAESRPDEARAALEALDVGYLDMIPLAFQNVEEWQNDDRGLSPIQLAMNVAIPEIDGAAEPLVYGGPTHGSDKFIALPRQIEHVTGRIQRRVNLRRKANHEKNIAIVLFNFPPNLGNAGTAAYLDVFVSVHRLLNEMKDEGYNVTVPESPEALRKAVVDGNSQMYGTDSNVGARLPLDNYRQLFPEYADIEPMWGRAPGELLTDGSDFYILGEQFGDVFVGVQPSFGYERDPMRMLMAKDAAPHHGFAAFYTWLEHIFDADAVLHFGTHGALEFMPGKQAGMSSECWPTRLLGSLPSFYYYSVNNPSEATIAKRRGASTLVSYMVPPLQQAGLYKGLRRLKDSIDTYRQKPSPELFEDIQLQAKNIGIHIDLASCNGTRPVEEGYIATLSHELLEIEHRMIPMGLHVLGKMPEADDLADILAMVASFTRVQTSSRGRRLPTLPETLADVQGWDYQYLRENVQNETALQDKWQWLDATSRQAMRHLISSGQTATENYLQHEAHLTRGNLDALWEYLLDLLSRISDEQEISGLIQALAGGYIAPSPGNDVVRNSAVVPTGRNIHGLDPFRVPTPAAQDAGTQLMREMLIELSDDAGNLPETIAMVLWGTDNLKSECEGVAQVFALLGARPVQDEMGNVSDVELIPLQELGRPRIDVVITVSGIFRDLLHHQMNLLDKAVHLAACADEPDHLNFVRKHTGVHANSLDVSFDEAATRVFSNQPGQYGANVNYLVESSNWEDDSEISEAFMSSKSYAYGAEGWRDARAIMEQTLSTVDATFQNIDSFEVGISDVDHYYEYLGGVTKSVEKLKGERPPVMVADAMSLNGRLSSLEKMVRLESRAKLLNPKWYESMLAHGYEGVREIETRVSNTYGWSATADAVEDWVYDDVAETFLLDENMRKRLGDANPHATASIARRLLEAEARGHWEASDATIDQLRHIYGDLEDRLEGIPAV